MEMPADASRGSLVGKICRRTGKSERLKLFSTAAIGQTWGGHHGFDVGSEYVFECVVAE